jgi:hypothetical protein
MGGERSPPGDGYAATSSPRRFFRESQCLSLRQTLGSSGAADLTDLASKATNVMGVAGALVLSARPGVLRRTMSAIGTRWLTVSTPKTSDFAV